MNVELGLSAPSEMIEATTETPTQALIETDDQAEFFEEWAEARARTHGPFGAD